MYFSLSVQICLYNSTAVTPLNLLSPDPSDEVAMMIYIETKKKRPGKGEGEELFLLWFINKKSFRELSDDLIFFIGDLLLDPAF